MFDFENALNPKERLLVTEGEHGPITLKLAGFNTNMAFDANRWQALAIAQRVIDADEFMFQIGLNRIVGWDGIKNEKNELVEFSPDMLNAWSRIVTAIPYIMQAGKATLEEAKVIKSNEKKIELEAVAAPTSDPAVLESNTPTG